MNPYFHVLGIIHYDPELHAQTKPIGDGDFTFGDGYAVGKMLSVAMFGRRGGLAVS